MEELKSITVNVSIPQAVSTVATAKDHGYKFFLLPVSIPQAVSTVATDGRKGKTV